MKLQKVWSFEARDVTDTKNTNIGIREVSICEKESSDKLIVTPLGNTIPGPLKTSEYPSPTFILSTLTLRYAA